MSQVMYAYIYVFVVLPIPVAPMSRLPKREPGALGRA